MKRVMAALLVVLLAISFPYTAALAAADDAEEPAAEEVLPELREDPEEPLPREAEETPPPSLPEEHGAEEEGSDRISEEEPGLPSSEEEAAEEPPSLRKDGGGADASAFFHAVVTANKESYTSGETALVTVRYTIDQGTVSPGDHIIVTIPEDIASRAAFSFSPQHFSGIEELGGGRYRLTFGEHALTGLSGSMTIRVTTHAEETTTDAITAGDGETEITVVGAGSGQRLSVYLGDIDYPVEIEYRVHVPAQSSVFLRNHSEVVYTQDGTAYQEHRDYIAQGTDYSAANGVKRVDKTLISDDPSDQWVTYTIEFWNENSFAPGEISLTDDQDGKRPESIVVDLYADGVKADSRVVTAENSWQYTFAGLDRYRGGREIEYTVREAPLHGYAASVAGDMRTGFFVTNTKEVTPAPPDIPDTGDHSHTAFYITSMVLSGVGLIGMLLLVRKISRR